MPEPNLALQTIHRLTSGSSWSAQDFTTFSEDSNWVRLLIKLTQRSNQSTWSSLSTPHLSLLLLVSLLWREKLNSPSRLCSSGLFFCQDAIYLEQLLEFLSRKLQFASSILSSDSVRRNCISIIEYFNHNLNYLSGYSIVSGLLLNTIFVKFLDEDFQQIKTKQ